MKEISKDNFKVLEKEEAISVEIEEGLLMKLKTIIIIKTIFLRCDY